MNFQFGKLIKKLQRIKRELEESDESITRALDLTSTKRQLELGKIRNRIRDAKMHLSVVVVKEDNDNERT